MSTNTPQCPEDAAAQALRESEERFRQIAESIDTVFWLATPRHETVLYVSPSFEGVWGRSSAEVIERPALWIEAVHPDDLERVLRVYEENPNEHEQVHRILRPDGEVRWVRVRVRPVRDSAGNVRGVVGTAEDVSERERAERELRDAQQRLEQSLEEKSAILREIHHRVKNNLQVVSSLLYLQSQVADDPRVTALMRDSRNRVLTIALVHETLYSQQDVGDVDVERYLARLLGALKASLGGGKDIRLEHEVESTQLGLELAMPCGLIVNELVTNAMKHAFEGRPSGLIRVAVRRNGPSLSLEVADDGVGMPDEAATRRPALGLSLVRTLVAQIGAELRVTGGGGTRFELCVPLPEASQGRAG